MKVIATRQGYYGQFIEEGEVFDIKDVKADFSERWMKKLPPAPKKAAPKPIASEDPLK